MELWIRSQDKTFLKKVNTIGIVEGQDFCFISENITTDLGKYKSKERALEVLDEIQSKLKATFLMKAKDDKYNKYILDGKKYLEELNGVCIVTGDSCFDLEPINSDVYVYEMPKE